MKNICNHSLRCMFASKGLLRELKIQLYMTLIRLVVFYSSQIWTIRKVEKTLLVVFERNILRNICRSWLWHEGMEDTSQWGTEEFFQRPDIIVEIARKRLMWHGYVWKKESSLIKTVIDENAIGKKLVDRAYDRKPVLKRILMQ